MKEKLCRMCYEEKPKRVSIFGGRGVLQKIAEVIRMHFADAVRICRANEPAKCLITIQTTAKYFLSGH